MRKADLKFADETSWKRWGKLCWLWAAATANIAVFVIHAKRSALGLAALLGEEIDGILHSDDASRFGAQSPISMCAELVAFPNKLCSFLNPSLRWEAQRARTL